MSLIKKSNELVLPSTIKMMLYGQAGMRKAQPLYCKVLTDEGFVKLSELKVGDTVIGSDGKKQKVEGIFPQGVIPVYKVTMSDGASTLCNDEHIWNVRHCSGNSRRAGFKDMTLREMIAKGILCKKTPRQISSNRKAAPRFEIPVMDAAELKEVKYEIHPYILGVLIGDGCTTGSVAVFSNPDKDIFVRTKVESLLEEGYTLTVDNHNCPQCHIVGKETLSSGEGYINRVKRLGLCLKSSDKFIPDTYLNGSKEQRLELLKGLMDTDGYCQNNRTCYSTTSKQLAIDVTHLVNSLGGTAKIHAYNNIYILNIRMAECPFSLPRKIKEWKPVNVSRYISDVSYVEDTECVCIKVSNDNGLYITDDYIVTHNTTTALSAPRPLLLDFDNGVKRVNMSHLEGVDIVQITSWNDVLEVLKEDLSSYQTIVVDTIGKMMDFIISHKCGTRQPQIRDWGAINQEFQGFVRNISNLNKNVIFVAHRDTRKEGDETVFIPALREKSYNSIVTELDLLGYMEARNENGRVKATVTFDPTNRNDGKNTCNLPSVMEIPTNLDAHGNPTAKNDFITRCVLEPYFGMLSVKQQEQKKYNAVIEEIKDSISLITDAESANDFVSRINSFEHVGSSLVKARDLLSRKVNELGLVYDKSTKKYSDAA